MANRDLTDIKYYLRRYDFPKSTHRALVELEKLTRYPCNLSQQQSLNELIDEFIFGEVEKRGIHHLRFSAVQELQLLEVLCSYFETQKDESVLTNIFLHLFPMHSLTPVNHRTKLLARLLSLGIAANNISILKSGALWMMTQPRSPNVTEVTKILVDDFFHLIPQSAGLLKDLPVTAPLFTAYFLTAVTNAYTLTVNKESKKLDHPPTVLLQQITSWVENYPRLCLSPRLLKIPSVQNSPFVITPISGLFSWTVLSPVIKDMASHNVINSSNDASTRENQNNKLKELSDTTSEIYCRLHYALLESMLQMSNEKPIPKFTALVCSDEFVSIIRSLMCNSEVTGLRISHESLDRFGQALQVSLSQRELHGNISEIMTNINHLPPNRLLSILQASHTPKLMVQDRR